MRKLPKKTVTQLSEDVKSLLILNLCNNDVLINMDHDDLEDDEEFSETEDETDEYL
jgi:hypothetical protein